MIWSDSDQAYICRTCYDNNYYRCECGRVYRYDEETTEVYSGPNTWEYDLLCEDCLNNHANHGDIFYDDFEEVYYYRIVNREDIMLTVKYHSEYDDADYDEHIAKFNIEKYIASGTIRVEEDGSYRKVQ